MSAKVYSWVIVSILATFSISLQTTLAGQETGPKAHTYDGNWWLSAEPDERGGFVDGAGDCLTWVAHEKGYYAGSHFVTPFITRYYESHPREGPVPVEQAWREVAPEVAAAIPKSPKGAEAWGNPHGYYDGLWWRGTSKLGQLGYLEGYLWCMGSCVKQPPQKYSKPVNYYAENVDSYLRNHPKADDEPVADILSRFQDKPPKM